MDFNATLLPEVLLLCNSRVQNFTERQFVSAILIGLCLHNDNTMAKINFSSFICFLYILLVHSACGKIVLRWVFNNIRRKWRLGAHRQLYTWRATEPLQDGTTPRGQQYPQPSHEPPPQCREKTKQNKTTLTWAPVTLKEIQWKPIK